MCICLHLLSFPATLQRNGALHEYKICRAPMAGLVHLTSQNSMTFHDFFHDFLKIPLPKLSNCLPLVVSKQSFVQLKLNLIFDTSINFSTLHLITFH